MNCPKLLVCCLLGFSLICGSSLGWCQEVQQEIVGLSIFKQDADSEYNSSHVPGYDFGTKLHVLLSVKGTKILAVKADEDDQPKLVAGDQELKVDPNSDISFFASIKEKGNAVVFPVSSPEFPAASAKSIEVAGEVTLVLGEELTKEEAEIQLKVGDVIELAGISVEITEIEDGWEDGQKMIGMETKQSMDIIQTLKFKSQDGKSVEVQSAGHSSFGFGDDMTYNYNYMIEAAPEKINGAEIEYYAKTVEKRVEVKLTTGLRLD